MGFEPTVEKILVGLTVRTLRPARDTHQFVVEVVGVEPTRLSDLIYSQASQPNAQHFLIVPQDGFEPPPIVCNTTTLRLRH